MSNKKSAIISIIALALILGGVFAYNKYYYKAHLINLPGTSGPVEDGAGTSTAESFNGFMEKGLAYKAEGDAGNMASYDKAIEAFYGAIEISDGKYWLPYLNLGNTLRAIGNFVEAEKAYDIAMSISGGGEITVYQAKIDSWLVDPTKKPEEIKALYAEAIANVLDNVNLIKSYAGYLRDRGDREEAVVQFEVLAEMFPENNAYKEEVRVLGN